jgi:hypothetical protein
MAYKYRDVLRDKAGNVKVQCSVLVKTYPALVTATIYSDNSGTVKTNPVVTDVNGEYEFYADTGHYTLQISGRGIESRSIEDIFIPAESGLALVDLDSDVTGILPVENGGTGEDTVEEALNALLPDQTDATDLPLVSNGATGEWTVLGLAGGGTGEITADAALNALLPDQTGNTGKYLQTDGSVTSWESAGGGGGGPGSVDLTTDVTGVLPIANGGTGQDTAAEAINALLPTQGSSIGLTLITDGSSARWGAAIDACGLGAVGDGATNNDTAWIAVAAALNAGKKVRLDTPGTYQCNGRLLSTTLTGSGVLESGSNVIYEATTNTNGAYSVLITGATKLIGGVFRNNKRKHYDITAVAVSSPTRSVLTIGTHDYSNGDILICKNVICTSGTLDTTCTVVDTTATTITVSAAAHVVDVSRVYPFMRTDGNGVAIYPRVFRIRTSGDLGMIRMNGATSAHLEDVEVYWSHAGIMAQLSSKCTFRRCTVHDTSSDAMHINGCDRFLIEDYEAYESGDDLLGTVGYKNHSTNRMNWGFRIIRPYLHDQLWSARGLCMLGAENFYVEDARIINTYVAGLIIGGETAIYGARNCTFNNLLLKTNGNTGAPFTGWGSTVHPSLLFSFNTSGGAESAPRSIKFLGETRIENARGSPIGGATGNPVTDVYFENLTVEQGAGSAWGDCAVKNLKIDQMLIKKCSGSGLVNTGDWHGKNKIGTLTVSDLKQGARRMLKSATVTDPGTTTVTLTLQDEYTTSALTDGAVVMVDGVGYGGTSSSDTIVNRAYALNNQFIIQSQSGNVYTCIQSGAINQAIDSTVTMTIATPCVVTWTAHELISGCVITLDSTGALPTGLTETTTSTRTPYWITVIDANTFNLSTSYANYVLGTFIATTGSQSGVHTGYSYNHLENLGGHVGVGTAMAATSDTSCYNPEAACPKAYVVHCNPTPTGSSYPINIIEDTIAIGSRLEIDELVIASDRFGITSILTVDTDDAAYFSLNKVTDTTTAAETSSTPFIGGSPGETYTYAYTTPFVKPGSTFSLFQSSASASTIEAKQIIRGYYARTGLTAPTTDTLDTTANIIRALQGSAEYVIHTWTVFNQSGYPLRLLAGDASTTLFGNFVVPANTSVSYDIFLIAEDEIQINYRRREAEHTYLPPAPKRKSNSGASSTVTMTIADPGVVTWTSHGLVTGDVVKFTTDGALPTGVTASTNYWITRVDANSFKLSVSLAGVNLGVFIETTGSQSGTHTGTVSNFVSAQALVGGKYIRSGLTAATTDHFDLAAHIYAESGSAPAGTNWVTEITNNNPYVLTLGTTGSTGVTTSGSLVISPYSKASFEVLITSSTAVTITRVEDSPVNVLKADVSISSAEILDLNANPKELIAAPGAGLAIIVTDWALSLDYGTVAYDGIGATENFELRYTDGAGTVINTVETVGFLDAVADTMIYMNGNHALMTSAGSIVPTANAAVVLTIAAGEVATGDSTMRARIWYKIVPTTF